MVKNLTIIGVAFISLLMIVFYFVFSGEDESEKKSKSKKSQDIAVLLGGSNSGQGNSGSSNAKSTGSVFDSDFYKSGKLKTEDTNSAQNPSPNKKASGDNPVNPQTGQPYPDEAMDQFEELNQRFPNNDLIPRRVTPEQKAERAKKDIEITKATQAVLSNNATNDDLKLYYNSQEKSIKDRLQVVEYLIEVEKDEGPIGDAGQVKKILDGTKAQMQEVLKKKEDAFKQRGIPIEETK